MKLREIVKLIPVGGALIVVGALAVTACGSGGSGSGVANEIGRAHV